MTREEALREIILEAIPKGHYVPVFDVSRHASAVLHDEFNKMVKEGELVVRPGFAPDVGRKK